METQPGLRVLLVGATPDGVAGLAAPLREAGYGVACVADGPGALRAVEDTHPDVVILDRGLPQGSRSVARGIQALAAWKKPFLIALTGKGEPGEYRESGDTGIDLYLVEPADLDKLVGLLRRFQEVLQGVADFDPMI